jgi:epoxyqueuosine reductase
LPSASQLAQFIKEAAAEAGFDLAGVAPVADFPELDYFPQWIAEHRHGEMRYLESRDEQGELKRASLKNAAPWAKSVVVCAINYNTAQPYSVRNDCHPDPEHCEAEGPGRGDSRRRAKGTHPYSGWISRYAWGQRDYHDVILPRLRELEGRLRQFAGDIRTWSYVDTGPIVERVFANHAGIGWTGKNTCIINQKLGSWLFLGVILTSIEIQPDLPPPDRCGSCTRCIEACPTDAFIAPHKLDASRCISYLTIEKRGAISEDLRDGIGRHVFGCDICQDVCPWNNKGRNRTYDTAGAAPFPQGGCAPTTEPDFRPRALLVNPSLEWLATISEDDFQSTFRGSPIKRAKRSGLRRNAVVAMGNSGNPAFIPLLRQIAESDPDDVVVEHARWSVERLQNPTRRHGDTEKEEGNTGL